VFAAIAETCSSPFHTPSCHKLDVTEEGTLTLEISKDGHCLFAFELENGSNVSCKDLALEGAVAGISTCAVEEVLWGISKDGHCMFAFEVENGSNFSSKDLAFEGTVVGISTCAVEEVLWGISKVAHPSFLGTDNSSAFPSEVTVEGCGEKSEKKSIDARWDVWLSWFSLKDGSADERDDWNKSNVGAWDGAAGNWKRSTDEADSSGALERSMLTDLVGPGGLGMPNALFWSGSEAWTGSEKKSTKLPEL